jgi:hypothetical protein
MKIKDRIKEFKRIDPALIEDNPKNWREHSYKQKDLMQNVLERIGIVDAVLVYEINGKYRFLDGHLRKDLLKNEKTIPALVIDCNEKEADVILATFDEITSLATINLQKQNELIDELRGEFDDIIKLMDIEKAVARSLSNEPTDKPVYEIVPTWDEAYNAVIIFCKSDREWKELQNMLSLGYKQDKHKKNVLERVLTFDSYKKRIQK